MTFRYGILGKAVILDHVTLAPTIISVFDSLTVDLDRWMRDKERIEESLTADGGRLSDAFQMENWLGLPNDLRFT